MAKPSGPSGEDYSQRRYSNTSQARQSMSHEKSSHRRSQQGTPHASRPQSGSVPMGFGGIVPDMMGWQPMGMSPNPASMLADAYGATHGQPQVASSAMEWYGARPAALVVDPDSAINQMANPLIAAHGTSQLTYPVHHAQLIQQFAGLQFQQQDPRALQQNMMLSQMQMAPGQRPVSDIPNVQMWQSPPLSNKAGHRSRPTSTSGVPEMKQRSSVHGRTAHNPTVNGNTAFLEGSDALPTRPSPADESKAVSAMQALRQQPMESFAVTESPDVDTPATPRPSSYMGRDRLRDSWASSPSVAQSMRIESKRFSALQRADRATDSNERRRSATPTFVIDSSNIDGADEDLARKANAVGMRIGPRMPATVHDVSASNDTPPHSSRDHDKSRGQDMQRPTSAQNTLPIIQPRRQPRGPPMESFFANNFLARKSLRTRREAMSKLCASPRAAVFSSLRTAPAASPLSKDE